MTEQTPPPPRAVRLDGEQITPPMKGVKQMSNKLHPIKFKDSDHRHRFGELYDLYNAEADPYRTALAYLIALTDTTYKHRKELYDETDESIKPDAVNAAWQTGTSRRVTLLAFNLFTSGTAFCDDEKLYQLAADNIFACELAPYFCEVMLLRYPDYFTEE